MISEIGYGDFDISVIFTSNATIRKYNKAYRDKDSPTDILSFPFHPDLKPGEKVIITDDADKNLGDILIAPESVAKKAPLFDQTVDEYLITLLAHGIAHLLNYDHQTDEEFASMQQIEQKLLQAIKQLKPKG